MIIRTAHASYDDCATLLTLSMKSFVHHYLESIIVIRLILKLMCVLIETVVIKV